MGPRMGAPPLAPALYPNGRTGGQPFAGPAVSTGFELTDQVQFLLHRAAPVSTTTPESISPTATQSNPVVFAPVTGSARPNWVGSTEGTKSVGVGVGVGAWPGSSAPRIGRTGSRSQVMV